MVGADSDSFSSSAPQPLSPQPQPADESCAPSAPQQPPDAFAPQQSLDCPAGVLQQSDLPVGNPTDFLINLMNGFSFCVDMMFLLLNFRNGFDNLHDDFDSFVDGFEMERFKRIKRRVHDASRLTCGLLPQPKGGDSLRDERG